MAEPLKILILAGEVSGDMYGASLMQAITAQAGRPVIFKGMGGDAMRNAGAELLYHTDQLAAMGITEVLRQLSFFRGAMREIVALGKAWRPDLVITIDYAGFNIRVAKRLHDCGIKTAHYISPKVWVWKRNRIYSIAKAIDLMLCIFPFEPDYYKPAGLRAIFVGNPLTECARETLAEPPASLPWDAPCHIGLLPGSRRLEITRILPTMLETAARIDQAKPDECSFVIPVPTRTMRHEVDAIIAKAPIKPARLHVIDGASRHVMCQSRAALIASGTATLEACLMRCPAVLTYKVGKLTELFFHLVVHTIKYVGLANIIAERSITPELIQGGFTTETATAALLPLLDDTPIRHQMLADYDEVIAKLGDEPVSARAARHLLALCQPNT